MAAARSIRTSETSLQDALNQLDREGYDYADILPSSTAGQVIVVGTLRPVEVLGTREVVTFDLPGDSLVSEPRTVHGGGTWGSNVIVGGDSGG